MKIGQHRQQLVASQADHDEVRVLYTRAMEGWNLGSGDAFAAALPKMPIYAAEECASCES